LVRGRVCRYVPVTLFILVCSLLVVVRLVLWFVVVRFIAFVGLRDLRLPTFVRYRLVVIALVCALDTAFAVLFPLLR